MNTLVNARTSRGQPIDVHLRFRTPPEESRVCVNIPGTFDRKDSAVIAADGDSVLIEIHFSRNLHSTWDYFVYNAGAAEPPRPPSLSLLPRGHHLVLDKSCTGLLRCDGDDEFVVAELKMVDFGNKSPTMEVPELHLLRCGEWDIKYPAITHPDDGKEREELPLWITRTVAVGDGIISISRSHVLQRAGGEPGAVVLAASGGGGGAWFWPEIVSERVRHRRRYVEVHRHLPPLLLRPCRCFPLPTFSQHIHHPHLGSENGRHGVVDSSELWSQLEPVVSLDDPHTICFVACESYCAENLHHDKWLILVDTRAKTVTVLPQIPGKIHSWKFSACQLGLRLLHNSSPRISGKQDSPQDVVKSSVAKSPAVPMHVSSMDTTIMAALKGIHGLDRDEILKAYTILSRDESGRRIRFLLTLPGNLRKEWLLLEI